jgi:hypothetical protein
MHLTTYFELEKVVRAFARGHLRLLILIGGHGLGKSQIVRQALAGPQGGSVPERFTDEWFERITGKKGTDAISVATAPLVSKKLPLGVRFCTV